jgi:hypothetical protein
MENTYDWIIATASSKVSNKIGIITIIDPELRVLLAAIWFPKSVRRRCPAIRLAVSRTERVKGRIRLLIVSIKTINGMRRTGVFWGIKWANIDFGVFSQPNSIMDSHIGTDIDRVVAIWLVEVKMYGRSPGRLLIKMNKKIATIICVTPVAVFRLIIILNSVWRAIRIFFHTNPILLGISQNVIGMKARTLTSLIQLANSLDDEGSKTEKILVIIFTGWGDN